MVAERNAHRVAATDEEGQSGAKDQATLINRKRNRKAVDLLNPYPVILIVDRGVAGRVAMRDQAVGRASSNVASSQAIRASHAYF